MVHELANCLERYRLERDAQRSGAQRSDAQRGDGPTTAGRVFALTRAEASTSSDLVKGKGKVAGKDVMILFDSGASHSFISYACIAMLGVPVCDLGLRLLVSMPAFASVVTPELCVGCPVVVNEKRRLIFPQEEEELLISAVQAESLLRNGAECYLLLAAMSVDTERVIAEIDVVRDFAEVFPDEVPGLPPIREMEFSIDLVLGARPMSVAPYRMAPAVLQWERPRTATNIQSFVGLANYYRRFIEGFSKIVAPLTQLTRKEQPFIWTDACERSFEELKRRLTTSPGPVLPDSGEPFDVYCDASHQGLGCLMYHPGKANVVADVLSKKSIHMSCMMVKELELVEEFRDLNLCVELAQDHISCGMITITSEFLRQVGQK
uniref:Retrovirus-related Pol polyprotein from transposon 412 family n=1 Tax=Cajanus cajan TaxID=3821 RepID=A0A151S5U8_CAJCA|nr:Retrovirus-related Pol polyprotein from transposon 412 family [Cajanus cajan]